MLKDKQYDLIKKLDDILAEASATEISSSKQDKKSVDDHVRDEEIAKLAITTAQKILNLALEML